MKLTPMQKQMVRKIASISSELAREGWALSDRRHEKLDSLRAARLELQKLPGSLDVLRQRSPREAGMPDALADEMLVELPDRVRDLQEYVADLEREILRLEAQQVAVNLEMGAAHKLAEALIKYTSIRHEDFPLANTANLSGVQHAHLAAPRPRSGMWE